MFTFEAARERQAASDHEGAAMIYRGLLEQDPRHSGALNNVALLLKGQGRFDTALACFERAVHEVPDDADILSNYVRCLISVERYADATRAAESGGLHRSHAKLAHAAALAALGNREKRSIALFSHALELAPEQPEILWDRSLAYLTFGDYERGWKSHDARFDWLHHWVRKIPAKLWSGEPLAGKKIWVYSDQGLGDALMCLRFLSMLGAERLVLDLPPELLDFVPLQEGWEIRPRDYPVPPDLDYHCPLNSLPARLGITLENLPPARARPPTTGRKVGLVWSGSVQNARNHERAMSLEHMVRLCAVPGIEFFSLQCGPRAADLPILGGNILVKDLAPFCTSMARTADYLSALDLLITVDTSCAHLAGVLGVPVWNCLMYAADWRYGVEGTTTPWYDSMRLVRQHRPRDWSAVIDDVRAELVLWSRRNQSAGS